MARWIEVRKIKTGFKFGDTYIIIGFVRVAGLLDAFKLAK